MRRPDERKTKRSWIAVLLTTICILGPGLLSGTSHALPESCAATPSEAGEGILPQPEPDTVAEPEPFNSRVQLSARAPVYWEETPVWTAGYDGENLLLFFRLAFFVMDDTGRDALPRVICGYRKETDGHGAFEAGNGPITAADTGGADDSWLLRVLYTDGPESRDVHSELGTVTLREHECISGAEGEPYLLLNGTIRVAKENLARLSLEQLAVCAGAWESGDDLFEHSELGSAQIGQYAQKFRQAGCTHAMTGSVIDADRHRMDCTRCGYFFQETHTMASGCCTVCGYRSFVSGTVRYRLNGRTEEAAYCEAPLAWVQAEQFEGYRKLADWQVPEAGGLVELAAEPICYTLTDGVCTYELQYDNSLFIPKQEQKGYEQTWYEVAAVRSGAD